ncbi:MAG: methyltransferase, partial [Acidobacteriota bacterium]
MRKPFQGLWNVIRFNWPFYVLSLGIVLALLIFRYYLNEPLKTGVDSLLILVAGLTLVSLLVSWYVYDLSGFYTLDWLNSLQPGKGETIVNINAGFDETSLLLKSRFADAEMIV